MDVPHKTWADIKARFEMLPNDSAIRDSGLAFVSFIEKTGWTGVFHPWLSMFDVYITQTSVHPFQDVPRLKISPLPDGGAEFRYIDTYQTSKQWVRLAERNAWHEVFNKLVTQLNWLTVVRG